MSAEKSDTLMRAADELERWLAEEQGTIDMMLVFSERGLQDRPLTTILVGASGELSDWQREEIAESLTEALAQIEDAVKEEYAEDWEPAAWSHFRALHGRLLDALDAFE